MCSGPRVHPALVNPNATANVYRIYPRIDVPERCIDDARIP